MTTDETEDEKTDADLARQHAEAAIAVLAEIMNDTDAPAGARVSAAKAILDRGWGKSGTKPPDGGTREPPVGRIVRVIVDPRRDSTIQESLATHPAERPPARVVTRLPLRRASARKGEVAETGAGAQRRRDSRGRRGFNQKNGTRYSR